MTTDDLSLEDIEGILAEPEPKKTSRARSKVDLTDRTIATWLKTQHQLGFECDVPLHDEAVTAQGMPGRARNKGMTITIGDYHVCRLCFLESADLVE